MGRAWTPRIVLALWQSCHCVTRAHPMVTQQLTQGLTQQHLTRWSPNDSPNGHPTAHPTQPLKGHPVPCKGQVLGASTGLPHALTPRTPGSPFHPAAPRGGLSSGLRPTCPTAASPPLSGAKKQQALPAPNTQFPFFLLFFFIPPFSFFSYFFHFLSFFFSFFPSSFIFPSISVLSPSQLSASTPPSLTSPVPPLGVGGGPCSAVGGAPRAGGVPRGGAVSSRAV